jgi:hypothetical protein
LTNKFLARKLGDMRDYDTAAAILDQAESWPDAAALLGVTPAAARALASRLRSAGHSIKGKGIGGRPSLARLRARDEHPHVCTPPRLGPS